MSTKISQLTSATDITASDLMQIVDVEDGVMAPSGTNKKATAQLVANNLAKIVNDGAVITANTSTDAVRITQTGSGNAIVVEDSPSPDATPFVVNNLGHVLIGNSTSVAGPFGVSRGLQVTNTSAQFSSIVNNANGQGITFVKTRGTIESPQSIVQLNDALGSVSFSGSDGSGYVLGSQIASFVDQVPGANDMPTCLTFATTPDGSATCTERMRITSAGNVGIGTATPQAPLDIESSGIRINASRRISSNSNDGSVSVFGGESLNGANIELYGSSHVGSPNMAYIDADVTYIRSADGASERMRITSAGNVGIGTATPSSKLHVAGDLTMSSATTATSATAGTNGDVPAQVAGYLVVNINGFPFKIPYYPA